ncbi:hypothetical protein ACPPVS_12750 [Cellulomonas sp. McL0617]|uniref:hypothetical protein n=1 Tax=Cellulomonas sp. McL0617 TaxID=3415675 RepID=UPI003CF36B00
MNPATYGGLFFDAALHAQDGRNALHLERFRDRDQAVTAIASYNRLWDATRRHIWTLLGLGRMVGLAASDHQAPVEAGALLLSREIRVGRASATRRAVTSPPQEAWDQAAVCLGAASDLLALHVNDTGGALTPDAEIVWEPAARNAALDSVAELVARLSSTRDPLALRAGQAGLAWERVSRSLPPTERAREAALQLRSIAEVGDADLPSLDGLTPAGNHLLSEPVDRLGSLVARIRRASWNLHHQPDRSMRTLIDVARCGFEVAVHTAVFHGVDLHDPGIVTREPAAQRVLAWHTLLVDLNTYLGTAPGNAQVHADVVAVHELLAGLVPRDQMTGDRGASADLAERYLGGTLHGACAGLRQAGEWTSTAFALLAHSEQAFVPITSLSRNLLSENHELAAAKLTAHRRLIAAPTELIETTLDRYRDVTKAGVVGPSADTPASARPGPRPRRETAHILAREPIARP